jgi:phage-related protein
MPFDTLDIPITGSAGDAKAAISSVKQSLSSADRAADGFGTSLSTTAEDAEDLAGESTSLAAKLFGLSRAASSAEGNIDEVGRSSAGASGGMTTFALTTEGAGFSVRSLSGSIALSLLPALATLTAALAPVVAALGGLAAIAGSIGLVGLVGVMGAVATNTEELKSRFTTLLETVKEAFQPVFEAATGVLLELMDTFAGVVESLVPSQDVIETIAESFEELGTVVIEALPAFAELATTLASEFLPPFVEFAEGVLPDIPGLVQTMIRAVRRVLPMFMDFGRFLGRFLPRLLDFGYTALPVVADALGTLGGVVNDVLGVVNRLGDDTGKLISQLSLVAPVVLGLASVLGGPVTAAIVGFGAAWATNFMDIRQTTRNVINRVTNILSSLATDARRVFNNIKGYISANQDDFAALQRAIEGAIQGVQNAFNNVLLPAARHVFENYLMPLIGELARLFARHYDDIIRETAETINALVGYLRAFGRQATRFWNNYGSEIMTIVRGAWSGIETIITTALDAVLTGVRVVLNLIQGDWEEAWDAIEGFVERTITRINDHLRGPAKDVLKLAMRAVTDVLRDVWQALESWLIGNSFIPDMISDIAAYIRGEASDLLEDAFGALVSTIENIFDVSLSIGWPDPPGWLQDAMNQAGGGIDDAFEWINNELNNNNNSEDTEPTEPPGGGQDPTQGTPTEPIRAMATGGLVESDGIAALHAGERVVPAAQVSDRGEVSLDASTIAEGVAQGFRRVDTGGDQPQEITIQLEDSDRYRTVRR